MQMLTNHALFSVAIFAQIASRPSSERDPATGSLRPQRFSRCAKNAERISLTARNAFVRKNADKAADASNVRCATASAWCAESSTACLVQSRGRHLRHAHKSAAKPSGQHSFRDAIHQKSLNERRSGEVGEVTSFGATGLVERISKSISGTSTTAMDGFAESAASLSTVRLSGRTQNLSLWITSFRCRMAATMLSQTSNARTCDAISRKATGK